MSNKQPSLPATLNAIGVSVRSHTLSILASVLPNRTKRLVCLASLSAYISGKTRFDQEMIHKLNQVMSLSSADSALKFPMQLGGVIWNSDDGVVVVYPNAATDQEFDNIISKLLRDLPQWLRYADLNTVETDFRKLFDNRAILA